VVVQAVITQLQRKIEKIEEKIAREDRKSQFYRRVTEFIDKNQPSDPAHMSHVDSVLLMLKMQLAEALEAEKIVDFELKHLTAQELPHLKVCAASAVSAR
jgi:hypothetical protein